MISIGNAFKQLATTCALASVLPGCQLANNSTEHGGTIAFDFNEAIANHTTIDKSDIIDSIVRIVHLETSDSSIVGQVFSCQVSPNRIFIFDNVQGTGVAIFGGDGKFIKRIPFGKGPGEIYNVEAIAYDPWRDRLTVLNSPFLMHYTKDGEHLATQRIGFSADAVCVLEDGYAFGHMQELRNDKVEGYDTNSQTITDLDMNVRFSLAPHACRWNVHSAYGVTHQNGGINVTVPGCDTIFTFDGKKLHSAFAMDYSSKRLDPAKYTSPVEAVMAKIQNSLASFSGQHVETSTHLTIHVEQNPNGLACYYDKRNNVSKIGYPCTNASLLLHIDEPFTALGDTLVSIVPSSAYTKGLIESNKFLTKEQIERLDMIGEEDNPILIFFTMKDFIAE